MIKLFKVTAMGLKNYLQATLEFPVIFPVVSLFKL